MRHGTSMIVLLLFLAFVVMVASRWFPSVADQAAEYIGEKEAGHAIVPEDVKQKWKQQGILLPAE